MLAPLAQLGQLVPQVLGDRLVPRVYKDPKARLEPVDLRETPALLVRRVTQDLQVLEVRLEPLGIEVWMALQDKQVGLVLLVPLELLASGDLLAPQEPKVLRVTLEQLVLKAEMVTLVPQVPLVKQEVLV